MSSQRQMLLMFAALLPLTLVTFAADKKTKDAKTEEAKPSYELPQPATEDLDYSMYQRIRDEGLSHSHVMEYASGLMDGIGPRLTGSPNLKKANEWTRDQLTAMGCTQRALGRLGRVRHGLAAAQYVGCACRRRIRRCSSRRRCPGRLRATGLINGGRSGWMQRMKKIWRSTKASWRARSCSSARCAR